MVEKNEKGNEGLTDYAKALKTNQVIAFVPGGNSMWPMLKNHKQSVIVGRKTQRLSPMDVALYVRREGAFVLHRVINVIDGGYVMCGDSQFSLEKVEEEQVIGVMLGFYKGKKYVDCKDVKYQKKVKNWYARKTYRKIRLKIFYKWLALKRKLRNGK